MCRRWLVPARQSRLFIIFRHCCKYLSKVRLYKLITKCVCAQLYLTLCDPMDTTGLPRQEYWSELPFHTPGDLPDPESEPVSLALAGSPALAGGRFFLNTEPPVNYIKTKANMQSSLCPNHLLHLTVLYILEVFTSVVYTLVGNAIKWCRATHLFPTPLSVTTHRWLEIYCGDQQMLENWKLIYCCL